MATTENETKPQKTEGGEAEKKRWTPLLLLAIPLSIGSLIWTTYSLLDFFQVGGIDPQNFRFEDLSIVGLSAAATADIGWSATMVAEYREVRLTRARLGFGGKDKDQRNLLPYIGWAEVFLVTVMLAIHGKDMGSGEAVFAAALPILTKLSWMMVISDLKDPAELTEEQKLAIAKEKQDAKMALARSEATAEKHRAELEELRRKNAAKLEETRAEIERQKLEEQGKFELEECKLRGENNNKMLRQRLMSELQMDMLDSRMSVQSMRLDREFELGLRHPQSFISGEVVRQSPRPALAGTEETFDGDDIFASLAEHGLEGKELNRARLALKYYIVNANNGYRVTKKAFAEANQIGAPRVTEATTDFQPEWFMERGLATWISAQN